MADISITAANVVADSTATIARGLAGASITAGQVVYLDPTTGKYGLADTDSATAAIRNAIGIALHAAAANQPLAVCTAGLVTMGATLTAGEFYYLSGTAGAMCPVADVASGDYPLVVGQATTTGILKVGIVYAGVVKA